MTTIETKRVFGQSRKKNPVHDLAEPSSSSKTNASVSIPDHSCALTMMYLGPPPMIKSHSPYKFKIHADEILILQSHTESTMKSVFKGSIKPNELFTFKSCRLVDRPLVMSIYINGIIEQQVFVCCENGFVNQSHFQTRWTTCRLQSITGGIPCQTCQSHELMNFLSSDHQYDDIEFINAQTLTSSTKDTAQDETYIKPVVDSSMKSKSIIGEVKDDDNGPTYNQIGETSKTETITNMNKQQGEIYDKKTNEQDNQSMDNVKGSKQMKAGFKQHDLNIDLKIMNEDQTTKISSVANREIKQLLESYAKLLIPPEKSSTNNSESIKPLIHSDLAGSDRDTKATIQCTDPMSMSEIQNTAESFVLIWLDATIQKNNDTITSEQKLRAIVNSLVTCHTINQTMDIIRQVQDQQIFLIVSGELGRQLVTHYEIIDSPKLNSIYIFCRNQLEYTDLVQRYNKVRDIFVEIDLLCARLKEDTEKALENLLPISTSSDNSANEKNQVKFLCSQLHRDLLFTMEYNNNAKLELADFCSSIYELTPNELEFIEELRTDYHAGKAISWYTRPTFLYKMLNKAFLTQDIPTLCKFRFFIRDLHMQLEQMHSLYEQSFISRVFTVYRGLSMTSEDFEKKIRDEIKNLIAFDSFLSTSLKIEVAKQFALDKQPPRTESVVFCMKIDSTRMERPFADITRWSEFQHEQEVLFSIGTVFRIDDVADKQTNDGIWIVHLSTVSEKDEQLVAETEQLQSTLFKFFYDALDKQCKDNDYENIPASNANIASMYFKNEKYDKSLEFYKKALDTLNDLKSPDPLTKATYISNVAKVHMLLGHENEALDLYKEALDILHNICERNDPSLIQTLHIIGHIYRRKKRWNEALKQYNQALEFLQAVKSRLPSDPPSIAVTYICIGIIFHNQQNYTRALESFSKALKQQHEHLSEEHPVLAFLYNNIGAMYYKMKQYDLALKNQLECLRIESKALPKEHKTFAETFKNIATTYEKLQKFDDALEFAQKCVNQLKLHASEAREELKDAMKLLQTIQQKRVESLE